MPTSLYFIHVISNYSNVYQVQNQGKPCIYVVDDHGRALVGTATIDIYQAQQGPHAPVGTTRGGNLSYGMGGIPPLHGKACRPPRLLPLLQMYAALQETEPQPLHRQVPLKGIINFSYNAKNRAREQAPDRFSCALGNY